MQSRGFTTDQKNYKRQDENRAKTQLAQKAGVPVAEVSELCIWGNHSPTMFPDFYNTKIGRSKATDVITDEAWLKNTFVPEVGTCLLYTSPSPRDS